MKRVLLIDDDPICNFINRRVIETTGLAKEIMVAENGRQGLELLIKCSKNGDPFPDLIVLDINMPILNGFEFLMYLRQLEISGFQNSHITILSSSDSLARQNEGERIRHRELSAQADHTGSNDPSTPIIPRCY